MFGAASGAGDVFGGLVPGGYGPDLSNWSSVPGLGAESILGTGALDFLTANDAVTGPWIPGTGTNPAEAAAGGAGGGGSAPSSTGSTSIMDAIKKYGIEPLKRITGLSESQLALLAAGVTGALVKGNTASNQKDTYNQLAAYGAPARDALNQVLATIPSLQDNTAYNFDQILNEAADRRARQWSEKVGNPVLSPQARISTEQDLAALYEQLRGNRIQQENQRIAALTSPAFANLGAAAQGIAGAQGSTGDAIGAGLGTVFDSIFNPQGTAGTSGGLEEVIALMKKYPWLFA